MAILARLRREKTVKWTWPIHIYLLDQLVLGAHYDEEFFDFYIIDKNGNAVAVLREDLDIQYYYE